MSLAAYIKTLWSNGSTPPLNAINLSKIEQGIKDVTDEVIAHEADVAHVAGRIYAYKNIGGTF